MVDDYRILVGKTLWVFLRIGCKCKGINPPHFLFCGQYEFFSKLIEADIQAVKKALTEQRLDTLRSILNAKQYRRIWMYCAEEKSVTEIAKLEGVTKASISLSLDGAMKKISKKFAKALKNT